MDKPSVRWPRRRRHKTGAPVDQGAPNCPICTRPMIAHARRISGELFWGCRQFPKCRGVVPYSASQANNSRLVWETKRYKVGGQTVSVEVAKAVPLDYVDPNEPP